MNVLRDDAEIAVSNDSDLASMHSDGTFNLLLSPKTFSTQNFFFYILN